MVLPPLGLSASPYGGSWPPDPFSDPLWYRGLAWRRIFAYGVDLWLIGMILWLAALAVAMATAATFGLFMVFHPLLWPLFVLTPLLYHSLQLGGPACATFGMRLFGLRAHKIAGGPPGLAQALIHTACFYGTMWLSAGLLLAFALFNPLRRTIHDTLAGVVILRNVGS